jgi:LEA14-like dessication related protein
VSVSGVTFSGATGVVALDVTNPNSFGVPLSGMDWQLSVGGARAFTGTVQLSQTIPAKAAVPVETTLSIGATDAITVSQMLARGVSSYRIDVTLHFSTKVGPVDVALHHDGELGSIVAMR